MESTGEVVLVLVAASGWRPGLPLLPVLQLQKTPHSTVHSGITIIVPGVSHEWPMKMLGREGEL